MKSHLFAGAFILCSAKGAFAQPPQGYNAYGGQQSGWLKSAQHQQQPYGQYPPYQQPLYQPYQQPLYQPYQQQPYQQPLYQQQPDQQQLYGPCHPAAYGTSAYVAQPPFDNRSGSSYNIQQSIPSSIVPLHGQIIHGMTCYNVTQHPSACGVYPYAPIGTPSQPSYQPGGHSVPRSSGPITDSLDCMDTKKRVNASLNGSIKKKLRQKDPLLTPPLHVLVPPPTSIPTLKDGVYVGCKQYRVYRIFKNSQAIFLVDLHHNIEGNDEGESKRSALFIRSELPEGTIRYPLVDGGMPRRFINYREFLILLKYNSGKPFLPQGIDLQVAEVFAFCELMRPEGRTARNWPEKIFQGGRWQKIKSQNRGTDEEVIVEVNSVGGRVCGIDGPIPIKFNVISFENDDKNPFLRHHDAVLMGCGQKFCSFFAREIKGGKKEKAKKIRFKIKNGFSIVDAEFQEKVEQATEKEKEKKHNVKKSFVTDCIV